MSKAESSNSSTTAGSGTQAPNLPWVPQIHIHCKGSEGPESLHEEHKNKRIHAKKPQAFCFFFHFFYSLWFCFCFPPEHQRPRWRDTWWSVYLGCTLKISLWCTFEWSSCLSRSGAGPQVLGEAASPHFCAGGSNVPGSPFFLFCNVLVGTATSCRAAAWFKVLRYNWLNGAAFGRLTNICS